MATFSQTAAYTGTIAPTRATPGLRSGGRNPLHGKAATYTGTIGSDAHNPGPTPTVVAIPYSSYVQTLITYASYSNLHVHYMNYRRGPVQPRQRLYPGVNSSTK